MKIEEPADEIKSKTVTLIPEFHTNFSHLDRIPEMIEDKLSKGRKVLIALEQTSESIGGVPLTSLGKGEKRRGGVITSEEKINILSKGWGFDDKRNGSENHTESCKKMLNSIANMLKEGSEVAVVGVDLDVKEGNEGSIARDKKMALNIKENLKHFDDVVYPVGSNHIYCEEDKIQGKRLGSLLKGESFKLEVKNMYPEGIIAKEKWIVNGTAEWHEVNVKTEGDKIKELCDKQPKFERKEHKKELDFVAGIEKKERKARSPSYESEKSQKKEREYSRSRKKKPKAKMKDNHDKFSKFKKDTSTGTNREGHDLSGGTQQHNKEKGRDGNRGI